MKEQIKLSDHFSYSRLIKFVMPSVVMMVFVSIYGVVDGFFVSNFVAEGKTALTAVNIIFPLMMILGGFGFMLGTGGTAIVAKTLGMRENEKANEYFTFITAFTAALGALLAAVAIIFAEPIAILFKAEGEVLDLAVRYVRIVLLGMPFFMLQNLFQNFFITAEKPKLGLAVTVGAGVTNMVLDALFIVGFDWGIEGAAAATALSQFVGGIVPAFYFFSKNTSLLRFRKTRFYLKMLIDACINGSSELMSNISSSLVTILYNAQLLSLDKENGVAAYSAIMYVAFIFVSIFIGFAIGTAPIVSFHFGANNTDELKNLRKKSTILMFVSGGAMVLIAILLSVPLCKMFVGYDPVLYKLTHRGFMIYAFSYVLTGFNIFGSSFFTALNNGVISAIISFLRTLVFQILAVLLLPLFLGIDGIWFSVIAAEFLSALVTVAFILAKKKQYNY